MTRPPNFCCLSFVPVVKISRHSPEMFSSISFEKADGFSLNFSLQFFSRQLSASRTLSGFSSLVSAARERRALASAISVSGVATAVEDRDDAVVNGLTERVGGRAYGTVVKAADGSRYEATAVMIK